MFVLIALKTFLEHWQPVEAAENWTYKVLQQRMAKGRPTFRQDVLVVDLGKIQPTTWERNGRTGTATPREPLKKLIEMFTDLGARAVSVDVDFSPENGELIHPDDNEFFQWCLDRSKQTHIPILLGIFRTGLRPEEWLGDDRFMRLAAYIGIRDPDRAIYWVMAKGGFPLRGVSSALAGTTWESFVHEKNCSWSCLVEPTSIIDYAPLERIREDVLHTVEPEFYRDEADKIRNRTIVIGDTYHEERRPLAAPEKPDWFHPTGLDEQIPGVFVHACAAATIAASKPIYQLTLLGRIFIDLLLAVIVLFLVKFSLWVRLRSKFDPAHAEHKFDLVYTIIAVIVVFVVGFLWVRITRLLWTDFLLVCFVLIAQLLINIFSSSKDFTPRKKKE
jgi:CHASE2 domain-containing sensor protein